MPIKIIEPVEIILSSISQNTTQPSVEFLRLGCYTNATLTCLKTGSLLQESASSSKNLDTHASYMSHLS